MKVILFDLVIVSLDALSTEDFIFILKYWFISFRARIYVMIQVKKYFDQEKCLNWVLKHLPTPRFCK